jgi:hypothetical protein
MACKLFKPLLEHCFLFDQMGFWSFPHAHFLLNSCILNAWKVMKGRRVSLHVKHIISWILYICIYIYLFSTILVGNFHEASFFGDPRPFHWHGMANSLEPSYHRRRPAPGFYIRSVLSIKRTPRACCLSMDRAVSSSTKLSRLDWLKGWMGKMLISEILRRKGSLRCGRTVHGNRWKWMEMEHPLVVFT